MRGQDTQQAGLFRYLSPEERVPATHPLRPIRQYVDRAMIESCVWQDRKGRRTLDGQPRSSTFYKE